MADVTDHRWTASDGVELAWHEMGEGRPVILLHGLFSDADTNWIKFGHAARIAAEGLSRRSCPTCARTASATSRTTPSIIRRGMLARDVPS